jgi:hypothetical protein
MCDGVAEVEDLLGYEKEEREKFLYPYEVCRLLKNSDKLLQILEEQYKPMNCIYDDLSVIIMQKPVVKIEKMIFEDSKKDAAKRAGGR